MAIRIVVESEVVDVNGDTPRATDAVFVDTNVWIWTAYSRGSAAAKAPHQANDYGNYLKSLLTQKAHLYHSALSLGEVAHIIEETELRIFNVTSKAKNLRWRDVSFKEFRHNFNAERANVVAEISATWANINKMSTIIPIEVDPALCSAALNRLGPEQERIDVWDAFMLESLAKQGIMSVLTDDGDFANLNGLTIFTANPTVLREARAQRKIFKR